MLKALAEEGKNRIHNERMKEKINYRWDVKKSGFLSLSMTLRGSRAARLFVFLTEERSKENNVLFSRQSRVTDCPQENKAGVAAQRYTITAYRGADPLQ